MRKKLRRLSTTHWCPAALDSLDATVRFLQQGPRALIPQHVLRDERPASIASPCATRRPALGLLPGTRLASIYFPPRCGLPRDGPHGPWHPGQIFLAYSRFSHLLKRNKTWDTSVATDLLPDLCLSGSGSGQFFPRFTWHPADAGDGALFDAVGVDKQGEASAYGQVGEVVGGYVRVDNVTDEIKRLYRDALGADISGDDIFHFVYGKLHDPAYRETYAADLKKMLPHIETPSSRAEFDKFVRAGEVLMKLHVGFEDVEPYPLDILVKASADPSDRETWRVVKPKWAKKKDPETGKNVNDVTKMIYNSKITIAGIPEEADEYLLGSRSALAWIIDRYQVKKDKASGIVNDPNDWADEVGNPRYIVDLIGKVTHVAVETVKIVNELR